MAQDTTPLSDDERAELERLRHEKSQRDERERQAAERAELERLRRESERAQATERARAREREAARAMEPDEDLSMPLPQRLIIIIAAVILVVAICYLVGNPA